MFNRVLVPLDGSIRSERALPVAMRIAKAAGEHGVIIAVRIVQPMNEYWTTMPLGQESIMPQSVIDAEISEASRYLATLNEAYGFDGITLEMVVLFGSVAPTIL